MTASTSIPTTCAPTVALEPDKAAALEARLQAQLQEQQLRPGPGGGAAGGAGEVLDDTVYLPASLDRLQEGPRGLRSVTVDSVRRGAEAEGLRVRGLARRGLARRSMAWHGYLYTLCVGCGFGVWELAAPHVADFVHGVHDQL